MCYNIISNPVRLSMKREAVVVEQKKVAGIVYAVLVAAAVFALGWFAGSSRTPSPIQVTVHPVEYVQPEETPAAGRSGLIDLNTADKAALETLPSIGPGLAERILEYRRTVGRFVAKEQLMDVEGIGEKRYAELEKLITVGGTP